MLTMQTIDRFCDQHGLTWTAFGREAAGDPKLVFDFREGRDPRPTTLARIHAYMADVAERGRPEGKEEKAVEPPKGQRAFVGNVDPLAERINTIADDWAGQLGIERRFVHMMLHSAVTPSRRWLA